MSNLPLVSVIIPCRNEERFIGMCLDSIIANEHRNDCLEVLVVDGVSEDRTRDIVEGYAWQYPFIRLLENPRKITPCALNIGIKNSKGEIIIRVDAHATYEKDYILKCVEYLSEYNADDIGGMWKILPRNNTAIGKGIVKVLSHPFGIGNAYYRFTNNKKPMWVDTVPFFCCRREVFEKVGLFNENLARGQDQEFNLRLKKAGAKTLLVPEIVSYYYARSDVKSFCRHNFVNGVWAILPFKFTTIMPVSWRHLVPLAFVSSLVGSAVLSFFFPAFLWLFLLIAGSYVLTNLYFSSKIASKERGPGYLSLMPVIFTLLHVTYGLGSLWGLLKVLISKQFWKKRIILREHS